MDANVTVPAIATISAGILISTFGLFAPLTIAGSMLATISGGLIYMLSSKSSAGAWIGYQVLAGFGIGLCFQAPIMAGQALAKHEDVATTTAILMFFQTLGGSLTLSAVQSAFANTLIKSLKANMPSINPMRVTGIGATEIRTTFAPDQIPRILDAYMDGLRVAFIFMLALFGISVLFSLAMPWTNIKGRKGSEPIDATGAQKSD